MSATPKYDGVIHPEDYNVWEPNELNDLTARQIDQVLRELVKRAKKEPDPCSVFANPLFENPDANTPDRYSRRSAKHIWTKLLKKFDDEANISGVRSLQAKNFGKKIDKTFVNYVDKNNGPASKDHGWDAPENKIKGNASKMRQEGLQPYIIHTDIECGDKNEHAEYGLPFLKCPCGTMPDILEREGVFRSEAWMVYCPRCRIHTDFYEFLDTARNTWNAHAILGEIHKDKKEEAYVDKVKDTAGSNSSIIRISKMETLKNHLAFFYTFDYTYMNKVKTMLKPGMMFERYGDLCDYFNEQREPVGNLQTDHKKWWKRFFSFEKVGNKLLITEIYENYIPWGKDPERPNKGRTMRSYRPRNAMDKNRRGGIDNDMRNEKHRIAKKVNDEIEAARKALYGKRSDRPDKYEDEEYEIFEDDNYLEIMNAGEGYDLEGLVDDEEEDNGEKNNNNCIN